jgi:hypothetical protein
MGIPIRQRNGERKAGVLLKQLAAKIRTLVNQAESA